MGFVGVRPSSLQMAGEGHGVFIARGVGQNVVEPILVLLAHQIQHGHLQNVLLEIEGKVKNRCRLKAQ